jgi:hypothetical protein
MINGEIRDMDMSLQHRIRERAYEIWNAAGRVHGEAVQHWLAAEREILAQARTCAETTAREALMPHKIARSRRPLTNIRPQPQKVAKAS